jgi:hypothetical protein
MIENNFRYCVECEYDGYYDCENSGCNDEGICRCYKIENPWVKSVDINKMTTEVFKSIFKSQSKEEKRDLKISQLLFNINDDINIYSINRILISNKAYLSDNWEISYGPGYYGDEVDNVFLNSSVLDSIKSDLTSVFSLNTLKDKMEFLLKKEYGFILPKISNKEYSIESVNRNQIILNQIEHSKQVSKKDLSYYKDAVYSGSIKGVAIFDGHCYMVIDGYHRITVSEFDNLNIVVLK